jgi:murein L,D-transpeptidase YafK
MHNRKGFLTWCVLLAGVCFCLQGCARPKVEAPAPVVSPPPPVIPLTAEQAYLKEILEKRGINGNDPQPHILLVSKQGRRLTVYRGLQPMKSYPVVLGGNPVADKLCQGDRCTPEGVYRVVTKFDHPKWDKFILLDYPNTQNWLKFAEAKKRGKVPLEADIGGEIGIHGTEDDLLNLRGVNWTLGCISLTNKDVNEIYPLVGRDTLVVIKKR